MSIKEYDNTSRKMVIDTPSGAPENVRHALNVLSVLGIRDDAMFMALVNDCLQADPLHLCRMVQDGVLSDMPEIRNERIAFSGTELHVPFGEGELPPREVIISLRDNALIASYFDKEDEQYHYIANRPVFDFQILQYMDQASKEDADLRIAAFLDLIGGLQQLADLCYVEQSSLTETESLWEEVMSAIEPA